MAWQLLTGWQPAPVVSAVLAAAAAAYLAGAWRVRRRHPARPWPAGRTCSFLLGLAVIAVAVEGGPGRYDDVVFSAHMIQHLLLIMAAPPLLVFGRPVTLALHAARNPVHTWVKRALRSRPVTALTRPSVTVVLYGAVVAGTHTPPVMDLVVRTGAAHHAEHLLYLATGYLYFLPVIGSEPVRWRVWMPGRYLLLLAGMQVDTVTGVVLMVAGHEIFPVYAHAHAPGWAAPPLAGLHSGGMIMFIGSDLVMIALALAVSVAFLHDPRAAGRVGGWAEGIRRSGLARRLAAAGVAAPPQRPGAAVDDDAHLAAYNAYLSRLGAGPGRGPRPG
ncbi:MAG: cytochrome c oxidase assembly protein [Gemmatimonadota bacterium]